MIGLSPAAGVSLKNIVQAERASPAWAETRCHDVPWAGFRAARGRSPVRLALCSIAGAARPIPHQRREEGLSIKSCIDARASNLTTGGPKFSCALDADLSKSALLPLSTGRDGAV